MLKRIRYMINASKKYNYLVENNQIKENKINLLQEENQQLNEYLIKVNETNKKYINYLLDKIQLIEKRRRANAGRVGGLKARNNKLSNDLAKAKVIINKLNEENKKIKNRPTMQEFIDYERTRKSPRKRYLTNETDKIVNKKNINH